MVCDSQRGNAFVHSHTTQHAWNMRNHVILCKCLKVLSLTIYVRIHLKGLLYLTALKVVGPCLGVCMLCEWMIVSSRRAERHVLSAVLTLTSPNSVFSMFFLTLTVALLMEKKNQEGASLTATFYVTPLCDSDGGPMTHEPRCRWAFNSTARGDLKTGFDSLFRNSI